MAVSDSGGDGRWVRRSVLKAMAAAGVGSAVFGRALMALAADKGAVTVSMIRRAEWISGLELTDEQRKLMMRGVGDRLEQYEAMRAVPLDNAVPPAIRFEPDPGHRGPDGAGVVPGRSGKWNPPAVARPATNDDLAFATVRELSALLRDRKVTSEELTRLSIERFERLDPALECVITLMKERALDGARRADEEIAAGRARSPLHGIPYGAKDLLAAPGAPTTWGAGPYRDQVREETATVVERLEDAGAVLVAKLTLGELAWGDVWYGGTTKNPWKTDQGSSGSSAGSAAATAAGCIPFAIGSETWGSIVSPCTRCGATGLRPTFGRVSRHGAMALSWSMDKLGPIARSVEDCALAFRAIHGADGLDPTAVTRPFLWPPTRPLRSIRVGYVPALFEEDRTKSVADEEDEEGRASAREWQQFDLRTLEALRDLGWRLEEVALPGEEPPDGIPVSALSLILTAEAATAFDDLTRSGRVDGLVRQVEMAWPNVFRQGQMIPAVEYLRANRLRTLLMRRLEEALSDVDVLVTPSYGGNFLLATNLTGHPAVVVPNGFRSSDGTPTSITFTGRLFGETDVLAVAQAYQEATGFHRKRPPV